MYLVLSIVAKWLDSLSVSFEASLFASAVVQRMLDE